MNGKLRAALIQMTSGPDILDNTIVVEKFIRQAAAGGARLIATPENTCHMRSQMTEKFDTAPVDFDDHPLLQMAKRLSNELNVHLLIGSASVRGGQQKLFNRSYLFRTGYEEPIFYDKIHLFDADLGGGQSYRESDVFQHGRQAVLANIDDFKLGMTICYDVRFPRLYRALAAAGAHVIAAPAAFAVTTGEAHWHILLRARAIENGVYVLAPAQVGVHAGGRCTFGHSMVIDPWGRVVAEMNEAKPGILYADLDLNNVIQVRTRIASLVHDQPFEVVHHV